MTLDPRGETRQTADGEGARWEAIRSATLERDDYTCQRCGYEEGDDGRRLEAHNTAPYGTASLEQLDRLVTLCGPCHATLHPDDPAYGGLREDAPLFPRPEAPPEVSTMRSDRQHVCQRCQHLADSASELAAYSEDGREFVLCKPCAGALLAAGYDSQSFEVAGDIDVEGLRERASEAPVRPAILASRPVRTLRPPETTIERTVYDTPLRYLVNPLGFTLLFLLFGVALAFLAL